MDKALFFHYDATCKVCTYTIFAAEPMVVRNGKRMHAQCAGFNAEQFLALERFPPGKDQSNPDVDLEKETV
jgi:hypothetical protein